MLLFLFSLRAQATICTALSIVTLYSSILKIHMEANAPNNHKIRSHKLPCKMYDQCARKLIWHLIILYTYLPDHYTLHRA